MAPSARGLARTAIQPRYPSHMRWWFSLVLICVLVGTASADDPKAEDFPALSGVTVSATSVLRGKLNYDAWHVLSPGLDHARFWCEGKPDDGIGEALTISFPEAEKVPFVVIYAGVWKSEQLFRANNIVTDVDVVTDDGRTIHATPGDKMDKVKVAIGGAPVKRLTFKIAKVKRGKMTDSCLSEIEIGDSYRDRITNVTAAQVDALVPTLVAINRALGACDTTSLKSRIAFPFSHTDWLGEDQHDNDHYKTYRYNSITELAGACSAKGKKGFGTLPPPISAHIEVVNDGSGKITIIDTNPEPHIRWRLELRGDHWMLVETSYKD